jgi:GNAT superfamily N-acetyltransferase
MSQTTTQFKLKLLQSHDLEGASQILARCYQGSLEVFQNRLDLHMRLEPHGCFGVWQDTELLGIGLYTHFQSYAYIGLIATDPQFQGRGVARAVMNHLLAELKTNGNPKVVLTASLMGQPLYQKMGFLERGRAAWYHHLGGLSQGTLPKGVRFFERDDLEWIIPLDGAAMGGSREKLLRLLPFCKGVRGLICPELGFAFINGAVIGPIVAQNLETAQTLLKAALTLEFPAAPIVYAAPNNSQMCSLLEAMGFTLKHTSAYMELNEDARGGNSELCFGMGSFAVG